MKRDKVEDLRDTLIQGDDGLWSKLSQLHQQRADEAEMAQLLATEREQFLATAQERFGDHLDGEVITAEVDAYLERIRQQVEGDPQPDPKATTSRTSLSFAPIVIMVLICASIVTIFVVVNRTEPTAKSTTPPPPTITTTHQPGSGQAIITLNVPHSAELVILYEISKVIGRWEDWPKLTADSAGRVGLHKTVFHSEGTYVYFAEVYINGKKYVSDQKRVIFRTSGKE